MKVEIKLSEYGLNLGSRILGKKVIEDFESVIPSCETVILDFSNVKFMALSFATELIHYLQSIDKQIVYTNATGLIEKQLIFSLSSKSKEINY